MLLIHPLPISDLIRHMPKPGKTVTYCFGRQSHSIQWHPSRHLIGSLQPCLHIHSTRLSARTFEADWSLNVLL